MTEFITRSCLSCGKELRINSNFNIFACGHCGCEHIVKREYGTISLVPVVKEKLEDGQCLVCKRHGRFGWNFSRLYDESKLHLPETHRCKICQHWVCVDCLSSKKDDGWICSRCRP